MLHLKIKAIILFIIVFSASDAHSQGKPGSDSTSTDTIAKKLDEVSDQLKGLYDLVKEKTEKSDTQNIGTIRLNMDELYLYTNNGLRTNRKVEIDSAILLFKDGFIVDLTVYTKSGRFTNKYAPIALTHNRFVRKDNLHGLDDAGFMVILQEAIQFQAFNSFVPDDGLVVLTREKAKSIYTLRKGVGLATILDLRLYTDALALFGDEPNGIFQTDARVKHYLHRGNIKNRGVIPLKYFKFNINLSRLDKNTGIVDSSNFSRTGLLQKSWGSAELAVGVLDIWTQKKSLSSWYMDIGAGINTSKLARTADTINITTANIFTELGLDIRGSENSGMSIYTRYTRQFSPETDFKQAFPDSDTVHQNRRVGFFRIGTEAFWNPLDDKAGRLFGRANYVFSTKSSEKKHHFFQFQVGYSILLSKLKRDD